MSSITTPNGRRSPRIRSWAMYDWANSAFSTTVGTVFLGPYVTGTGKGAAAGPDGMARFLGLPVAPASFLHHSPSRSRCCYRCSSCRCWGAIADYSHIRKQMLILFATMGASATVAMFFVTAPVWWLGGVLFVFANLCFGASIVFYNAYLPDICQPGTAGPVSSLRLGDGISGGSLLLLFNLIFFQFHDALGISSGLAVRINLASAGLWWLGFSMFTWRRFALRQPQANFRHRLLQRRCAAIAANAEDLRHFPQTVFVPAGLSDLQRRRADGHRHRDLWRRGTGAGRGTLSMVILVVQFVAFFGALFFGWLAGGTGTKRALVISLVIWSVVVIYAYGFLYDAAGFFILGVAVGVVLGGSRALSRSLFSQMIPAGREAEYFSLYEISERGTSWLGPFVFALVNQFTGSLRLAILSVILFFVVGLVLLVLTNTAEAIAEARRRVAARSAGSVTPQP